jgi:hypothetical protein
LYAGVKSESSGSRALPPAGLRIAFLHCIVFRVRVCVGGGQGGCGLVGEP